MRIVLPKTFVQMDAGLPVFFLAGPVQGGGDWQMSCCREIDRQMGGLDFYAVIPYYLRVLSIEHLCHKYRAYGPENHFTRQLDWERHYLDLASKLGSIIFWLPTESKDNPRPGGDYARDTRGELGEWRGRLMSDRTLRVVIGGEPGFSGIDLIERNFKHALGDKFTLSRTLPETVAAAIRKLR